MQKLVLDHIEICLQDGKKAFFVSDLHLGFPSYEESRKREKLFVDFIINNLDQIGALFFLGDVFDFWFEYKHVIFKGFSRFFGILARLNDLGIPVYYFYGNHDHWHKDFFKKEFGISMHKQNALLKINGLCLYVGHGDGLGSKESGYRRYKAVLCNKPLIKLFSFLPTSVAAFVADKVSNGSKNAIKNIDDRHAYNKRKLNSLMDFMRQAALEDERIDGFVFAHSHMPLVVEDIWSGVGCEGDCGAESSGAEPVGGGGVQTGNDIKAQAAANFGGSAAACGGAAASLAASCESTASGSARKAKKVFYINVGDWLSSFTYGEFDGKEIKLKTL